MSNKKIETVSDMAGLKIRVMQNKYQLAAWEALGAAPTPMDWGEVYVGLQQKMIDVLDQADRVHITGKGANKTDLYVNIWKLRNPEGETAFENCVADVNIPVGEVFTSPVLEGTNGKLHVGQVYLNGLNYKNLEIDF